MEQATVKTNEDGDIIFDLEKDFPEFKFNKIKNIADLVWPDERPPENTVNISTMIPSLVCPSALYKYCHTEYISTEDYLVIVEIFNTFPPKYVENFMAEMKEYREKNGRFLHSVVVEIRLKVNEKVIEATKILPHDQKYKNLVLAMVRYKVGYFIDDIGGD